MVHARHAALTMNRGWANTTIRALVAEGMGVAVVPRSVAEAPGRAVVVIHVPMIELTRTVVLAYRVDHCHSAAADAYMTFLRETQAAAQSNEDPLVLF